MARLSIIISMYNDEKYICRCLKSIEQQTNKDFEIICVDDYSTDRTVAMCSDFSSILPITMYVMNENSGLSAVRQKGLSLSNCEYVCFVDADDELSPDYVDIALKQMDKNKCDVCIFRVEYNKDGIKTESPKHEEIVTYLSHDTIESSYKRIVYEYHLSDSWDKVYRRDYILSSGVTFCMDRGVNGSDSLFNKMLFLHNPKVAFLSNVLYIHYSNPNSMVTRKNKDFVQMAITMLENLNTESEKLSYVNVKNYNRMLFYSILRSDYINKLTDKQQLSKAVNRSRQYIELNSFLKDPVSTNVSLTVFQCVLIHMPVLLKPYLYIFKKIKS